MWVSTAGRSGWRGGFTMSAQHGRGTTVSPAARAGSLPASSNEPAAPPRTARNAMRFGPRTPRCLRSVSPVNPATAVVSGRAVQPTRRCQARSAPQSRDERKSGSHPGGDTSLMVLMTVSNKDRSRAISTQHNGRQNCPRPRSSNAQIPQRRECLEHGLRPGQRQPTGQWHPADPDTVGMAVNVRVTAIHAACHP